MKKTPIAVARDIGFFTIALTLALLANFTYAAWSNPEETAPGGNVELPINTSLLPQAKSGNFGAAGLFALDSVTAGVQMNSPKYCDETGVYCLTPSAATAAPASEGAGHIQIGDTLIQWGVLRSVPLNQSFSTVSLPTAYPGGAYTVTATIGRSAVISGTVATVVRSISANSFRVAGDHDSHTSTGDIHWQTIGSVSGSDNYVEVGSKLFQWGVLRNVNLNQSFQTVLLPTPFADSNYSVSATIGRSAVINGTVATVVRSISANSFRVAGDHDSHTSTGDIHWFAVGEK